MRQLLSSRAEVARGHVEPPKRQRSCVDETPPGQRRRDAGRAEDDENRPQQGSGPERLRLSDQRIVPQAGDEERERRKRRQRVVRELERGEGKEAYDEQCPHREQNPETVGGRPPRPPQPPPDPPPRAHAPRQQPAPA